MTRLFTVFCIACAVNAQTVSYTETVTLPAPAIAGTFEGPTASIGTCPTSEAIPRIISASTMLTGAGTNTSNCGFSVQPSATVSNYSILPAAISITLPAADGVLTHTGSFVRQQLTDAYGRYPVETAAMRVFGCLGGTGPASLTLSGGTMTLIAASDTVGFLMVDTISYYPFSRTIVLSYAFKDGLVTESTGTVGLGLPAIGSSPSFSVSFASPIAATTASIAPGNVTLGSGTIPVRMSSGVTVFAEAHETIQNRVVLPSSCGS